MSTDTDCVRTDPSSTVLVHTGPPSHGGCSFGQGTPVLGHPPLGGTFCKTGVTSVLLVLHRSTAPPPTWTRLWASAPSRPVHVLGPSLVWTDLDTTCVDAVVPVHRTSSGPHGLTPRVRTKYPSPSVPSKDSFPHRTRLEWACSPLSLRTDRPPGALSVLASSRGPSIDSLPWPPP